jgi:hypothetical protein
MDDTTIGEAGRKDRAASSIRGLAVNAEGKGPMMRINIAENDKWKGKALYGGSISWLNPSSTTVFPGLTMF